MNDENKTVAKPEDESSAPKNETPNLPKPLTPWSTYAKASAFHNFGSTPTPSLTPASPQLYSSWFGSHMWNRPVQYGSPYQSRLFSNYPMAAWVGQSSLLASANTIERTSAENNMHLKNQSNMSSQPTSNVTPEAEENEKRSSIQETNLEGSTKSATSESKETTVAVNDNKNDGGSTKESDNAKEQRKRKGEQTSSEISSMKNLELQDIPLTKQQKSTMMPATAVGARNVTSTEHSNSDNENTNIETDHFEANPTDPNPKLHIDPYASAANPQLEKEESNDTKEQRKSKAMNKSAERPRMKIIKPKDIPPTKQQQSSMIAGNGGGVNNVTSTEANRTELNRKFSTKLKASATNPQLEKKESDEAKEQRRRQSKKKSAKRSRMKMKIERQRLNESIKNLDVENAELKEELRDLIDEYDKLTENNNSLQDELNQMFGQETVMEVFNEQSADPDADDDKISNDS